MWLWLQERVRESYKLKDDNADNWTFEDITKASDKIVKEIAHDDGRIKTEALKISGVIEQLASKIAEQVKEKNSS